MKDLRNFGVSIGATLPITFGLIFPWILSTQWPIWPWVIGAVFLVLGLVKPSWLSWPHARWTTLAAFLGRLNTHVLMFLVFSLLFVPVGLLRRMLGVESLRRRSANTKSHRTIVPDRSGRDMDKPY